MQQGIIKKCNKSISTKKKKKNEIKKLKKKKASQRESDRIREQEMQITFIILI